MENKTGTLVSGLGGAAILALFMAPGGSNSGSSKPIATSGQPSTSISSPATISAVSHSDAGPWTAICQDYQTQFDTIKPMPGNQTGATAHALPAGANPDAIEYVKKFSDQKTHGTISEKYEVRSYPEANLRGCIPDVDAHPPQVLLATIPDPIGSHFAMYFDRDIEALEAAAALSEFSLSHFWLPWDTSEKPNPTASTAAKLAAWKERLDQPGVLVFHKGTGERLFIFLAAETPTSGIQRPQFGRALTYMQQLLGKPALNQLPVFRIAGPHFSASLLGMAEVLRANIDCSTSLHILSPTANSNTLIADFTAMLSPDKVLTVPPCDSNSKQKIQKWNANSWFVPLSPTYNEAAFAAFNYLSKLGYCRENVAILREDESAVSIHPVHRSHEDSWDEDSYLTENQDRSESASSGPDPFASSNNACETTGVHGLELSFPRDLSSLRNKTDSLVPANTEINGIKLPFWSIPVTLGETIRENQDSPGTFAVDQEAGRIDHDLQAIVSSLRQHKIRAIIIDASNDLDTLFLLEYFLRALPNIRFVTLNADHFAIGRSQNVELTGTVAITGLPLLRDFTANYHDHDEAEDHTKDKEPHVFFESSDSEGTYLATTLLLHDTAFTSESKMSMAQCATASVAARSEFLMMHSPTDTPSFPCIREVENSHSFVLKPGSGRGVPRCWTLTLFAVFIAGTLHLVYLWNSNVLREDNENGKAAARFFYSGPAGLYESKRLGMLLALNFQYLLLSLAVCAVGHTLVLNKQYDRLAISFQYADMVLAVTCINVAALLVMRGLLPKYRQDFIPPLLIASAYTACSVAMGWDVLWRAPGQSGYAINALRIVLLPEGVSPFIPFLAITIAYIVYCRMELNNIGWAARRQVMLDFGRNPPADLNQLYNNLQHRLVPFSSAAFPSLVAAVLLVTGVCVAFRLRYSLFGFDGLYFRDWLIVPGFGCCLILVTFTVLRAWDVWRNLRALLRWLHLTKLQLAFKQLHERDLPKLRVWDLGRRDQDLTIQTLTVESMEALVGEVSARPAKDALTQIRLDQIGNCQHCPGDAEALMNHLTEPMERALKFLHREPVRWDSIGIEKQRYLALRFVALIRYTLLNIRNMYTFVVYGFALLVVCVATYPFEGKSNLTALLTAVFCFILISVGVMFAEIQKDTVLSLIENSPAGEVGYGELVKHLVSIGGVPALIVVATQFPSIAQLILTWAKPGLDLMK